MPRHAVVDPLGKGETLVSYNPRSHQAICLRARSKMPSPSRETSSQGAPSPRYDSRSQQKCQQPHRPIAVPGRAAVYCAVIPVVQLPERLARRRKIAKAKHAHRPLARAGGSMAAETDQSAGD